MKKNGYNLTKKWFEWCLDNRESNSPTLTALYLYIIERCNSLGWKEKFGIPTEHTMYILAIGSYNTYKKHLEKLHDIGFIKIHEKSKNQFSSNIIGLSNFDEPTDEASDEPTDEALDSLVTKQVTPLLSHNKTIKQETKKEKESCYSFIEFWDTYQKKVGRKKSEAKYKKISEDDRKKIKDTLVYYVKSTELKFRKDPCTYLNGEHWNDEIISSVGPDTYKPRKLKRLQD